MMRNTRPLLAIALACAMPAAASAAAPVQPATLVVQGHGSVTAVPDQLVLALTITTSDDDGTRATSDNNGKYAQLMQALGPLGIRGAAIRTTNYNISYNVRPAHPDPASSETYGVIVRRDLVVTSPHTENAGAIIDAAVNAGITEISSVNFELRDPGSAYRASLTAAVADARAQADVLANAAHLRITRVVQVAPGGEPVAPIRPIAVRMTAMKVAVPTDIQPGNLNTSADVTVIYEAAPR